MRNYYNIDFKKQKESILKCEAYKYLVEKARNRADAALEYNYTPDRLSNYVSYFETGRRVDDEAHARRSNACALAIAYYLFGDKKYLDELIDVIHIICNEYTWCIPAHVLLETNPDFDLILHRIDLFQAGTAKVLTEISVLLSEEFPYHLNQRIEYELRRRIFDAYKTYPFFHTAEGQLNNWSAVCAGGCGTALLHFGTAEEIKELLPRIVKGLDRYLQGLTDDGCCQEGIGYWYYGFGNYIAFARVLYNYSKGEMDYIHLPACQRLALFEQKARLNETLTVSFSDSDPIFTFDPGFSCYLKDTYDGILLPDIEKAGLLNRITASSIINFFLLSPEYVSDKLISGTSYFETAQWYINRKEKFCFAAKGGHNYEPHNHNDLGNFLITVGDEMPLADLGAPEYIRYDEYDDRMVNLNFSSKGHSVPIINGELQMLGEKYKSSVTEVSDNVFSLDLEGAYSKGLVNKYNRTFTVNEGGVVIKDVFEYSELTRDITERFITRDEPKLSDGEISLGTASIIYDKNLYDVNISLDFYNAHSFPHDKVTVYLIDFTAKNGDLKEFDLEIKIN